MDDVREIAGQIRYPVWNQKHERRRRSLIKSLGQMDSPDAQCALMDLATDSELDEEVRALAAAHIRSQGDPVLVARLAETCRRPIAFGTPDDLLADLASAGFDLDLGSNESATTGAPESVVLGVEQALARDPAVPLTLLVRQAVSAPRECHADVIVSLGRSGRSELVNLLGYVMLQNHHTRWGVNPERMRVAMQSLVALGHASIPVLEGAAVSFRNGWYGSDKGYTDYLSPLGIEGLGRVGGPEAIACLESLSRMDATGGTPRVGPQADRAARALAAMGSDGVATLQRIADAEPANSAVRKALEL